LEQLRHSIAQWRETGPKIPTSMDLPLTHECKRALVYASEEAKRMNHRHTGTAHLLLGLLREEKSFAAQLLREQGLTLELVREHVHQSEPSPAQGRSASMAGLNQWLADREAPGSVWTVRQERAGNGTTQFVLCAADIPKEPPPRTPRLRIEIIRDDLFSEVGKRCDDYVAGGVDEVWILDPRLKRAYTVTKTEGLREFKGEILRIASPSLEMDLKRIFD
jgi:hypothetical protein